MKTLKRLLAITLILALAAAMIPTQVFARAQEFVVQDVTDPEVVTSDSLYLASTNLQYSEDTDKDYLIRVARGGEGEDAVSVTVKLEDFSAHYGRDYTVSADGKEAVCPDNALAITDLFMGDYTVSRQQGEEELENEEVQQGVADAMAQANELVRSMTGIEAEDAPLSALEQARAAQTGVTAPQQRISATDQTEEQIEQLSALVGDLIPGAELTVSFAAGEREKYLTVHPIDNQTADGDRYFTVRLVDAVGTTISTADSLSISIIDDEEIAPCEVSFGSITQDGNTLTVNVERTGCINQITHLKLKTKPDGTAVEGRDFSEVETDVLFPMGAPATSLTVPINTAYLEEDADFTLELEPVANAEVETPTTRVELKATPAETYERNLTTVCVNPDLDSVKDRLVSTRHSGNFAGLLGYNDAAGAFEMKWTYSSLFGLPWIGYTEAVFSPEFPSLYYSGLRLTLEKSGDEADLGIGWGTRSQIEADDDYEWEVGGIHPDYFSRNPLTKQDKVFYFPTEFSGGLPIEIEEQKPYLRIVNEANCWNCDKVSIYSVAPIYRWYVMELVTDKDSAPQFLNANGDYVPSYSDADAVFVGSSGEAPNRIQFHLDEAVAINQQNRRDDFEPFCKIKSLSSADGFVTLTPEKNTQVPTFLMDEGALQTMLASSSSVEWSGNAPAGVPQYATLKMHADYEYTNAKIKINDAEDGSYGTLKLSGKACPASDEAYPYHRGDTVYITCEVDPGFADRYEFVGVKVRTKINESDINWKNPITIEAVNGGLYLDQSTANRLQYGYYEITPIFNYKYNTVTVRVEKSALGQFDQSYGIFKDVTPKTVNYNGVTYLQYVFPNAKNGKLYSFCARGKDATYCPVWREDRDPKAVNYSAECFYYTAREEADKNYIYLTTVHRSAGYAPVTIQGTLLRNGYNAMTGFADDDAVSTVEGAIAVCGESSCLTNENGAYTIQALCPSGNTVRYLLSVNGQIAVREVVATKQTVTDTVTLNPENGTLIGALNISFAETDPNKTVLILNGTHSRLIVSDDGGYAYLQTYRTENGTVATKTALERLTKVTVVIRDTDGSIRATFPAEQEDGRFICDLEHSALCNGDRLYLKLTTDRLADTLAQYDENGNLVNPDAILEQGHTEYAEVFSGYSFAESWREELPIVLDVNCLPKYTTGLLPFIGEAGYDFTMGPVNLAIEERDGEYMLRFGVSVGRILDYTGVTEHMTNYAIGTNGEGREMYGGDFMGDGNLQASYTKFIKNIWGEVFGKDKNDPKTHSENPAKLGGLAWRFDVVIGLYFKFSRLEAYGGGMNGQRSDFYFTGWGGYLGLQAGYNITHYWILPVIYLPAYIGLQFDASLVGTIGESIDRNNLTHPISDMSSVTSGFVDLGQEEFDQIDGSIRFSIIGVVFGGVGLYGYLGIRIGGRIIAIGLWEPKCRDEVNEDSGTIAFLSVGGWLDVFLFSIPMLCTFEPVRNGIFKEYMTQTNAPDGVSVQVGEMSLRKPYNDEASEWKGSRPATRSAFSESSKQILVENPYEHPEAKLLSLTNGDTVLAYIDKLDTDDPIDRTVLKLARCRDGKWSEPITVQNDGRADFQPSLCETRDGKVLISWVSTDKAWERKDESLDFLKSLDVFSAVVNPDTMAVTELTQLTDDEYYDSAPISVCDMESGEYAVYYTKASAEDYDVQGNLVEKTAEELLNICSNGSIIAYLLHADAKDGKGARWLFDYYFPGEYASEKDRDELLANWNGQRFLAAPIESLNIGAANIADLTATTYNGLAALAYTVDADSSNDTVQDKELFVQYYRFAEHKLYVPVRLTDDSVSDTVPQFARSTGENAETLLFWLRDNREVTYLSVSDLIREGTADDGTILDTYRVGENHEPSSDLSRLYSHIKPGGMEPDSTLQWSSFRTAVTDDDIYVVWTQPAGEEDAVELYASALIRSEETENCGTDWSNPYRLTYDGRIADTPYLAVDKNGDMIAVYNSYSQEVTEDPENPLIVKDMQLCAATLVPCGAVEVEEIDVTDSAPEAGQTIDIPLTLVNNGLTFAEGYELDLYAGDTLIDTYTTHARMRPAQRARFSFNWTVPEDFEGLRFRAVVKELGGEWTNTHERETEPLQKAPVLEILEPVTYQTGEGFRMVFRVANYGNAASTEKDTFMLSQVGPFASDCGLEFEEKTFAELSLAGIAAGDTEYFDIAVNVPEKAFRQFGYVSCIAEIYHDGELRDYTSVDIEPLDAISVLWNGGELPDAIGMVVGETMDVSLSTVPAVGEVILSSSDPTVVSVEDGKIVAVGSGSAELTGIILPSGEVFGPIPVIIKPNNPFVDVAEKDWYYNAVMEAYEKGLMVGITEDTFDPNGTMSRAMLVSVLHRMQGSPAPAGTASFTDVKAGKWYTDAVLWAAEEGIVSGIGGGKFAPKDPVTREQFASIIYRYAAWLGYDTSKRADLSGFTDERNVSSWAVENVKWAVAEGLISGKKNHGELTIDAKGETTRAEGCVILTKADALLN